MLCAHTGYEAITMRTESDCMICALAMFSGRSYDDVLAAARVGHPEFPDGGPLTHSMLRVVASRWNMVLLSSVYMLWEFPAIIGVISPTIPNCGHAVFWDGEKIIDPYPDGKVDKNYVSSNAIEFTQRADDLSALIHYEKLYQPQSGKVSLEEFW